MSTEANKAIVRRHAKALNDHDLAALDEIWDPELVGYGKLKGLEPMKELIVESFRAVERWVCEDGLGLMEQLRVA